MISGYSDVSSSFWTVGPWGNPIYAATILSIDLSGWSGPHILLPATDAKACAGKLTGVSCKCSTKELMMRGCVCGAMAAERAQAS